MSDTAASWRESAAELHRAELAALEFVLERLEDLEQLFRHRGDEAAREQLRPFSAFLRSRAGDVAEQLTGLELEQLESAAAGDDWQEQSY